ncbi:hypothetical protein QR680_013917 [Steinernema hermaphroditum]|uniref:Uncharacterized protein n=1 Tax=Steinernema hermaphroditum TaxID=289476 RepID=A0AA39I9F1_9BILA|nr:hypothetical protein QR680_013917 [Steinernema hermaphroditum]
MESRLKVVVVGDSYVGKTSLLFAYTEKSFHHGYNTTVFENWSASVTIDQRKYTVNLFDTAGQEDYAHLRRLSYPQTNVFLLCFSLIDPNSLERCRSVWINEIRKYVGSYIPVLLVGTKEDLHASGLVVNRVDLDVVRNIATEIGAVNFLTCSSLTHRGLKRVFDEAFLAAIGRHPIHNQPPQSSCCTLL